MKWSEIVARVSVDNAVKVKRPRKDFHYIVFMCKGTVLAQKCDRDSSIIDAKDVGRSEEVTDYEMLEEAPPEKIDTKVRAYLRKIERTAEDAQAARELSKKALAAFHDEVKSALGSGKILKLDGLLLSGDTYDLRASLKAIKAKWCASSRTWLLSRSAVESVEDMVTEAMERRLEAAIQRDDERRAIQQAEQRRKNEAWRIEQDQIRAKRRMENEAKARVEAHERLVREGIIHIERSASGYGGGPLPPGTVFMANTESGKKLVVVVRGKSEYIRDDGMLCGLGDDSGYFYYSYCRAATGEETTDFTRALNEKNERRTMARELKALIHTKGKILTSDQASVLNGSRQDFEFEICIVPGVRDFLSLADSRVFWIKDNGLDGDDWSRNNWRGSIAYEIEGMTHDDFSKYIPYLVPILRRS